MFGTLHIVATPIGNLSDISARGIETLKLADLILAEDTRVTSKLLSHYKIPTKLVSYHQHSGESKRMKILKQLVEGLSLALVTDAGTPGISDPGNELIDWILEKEPDIKVVPIPGASALVTALSACGFRTDKFTFLGFLPKKGLYNYLLKHMELGMTVAFFESPKRLKKTLKSLEEVLDPSRRVFVARELTKLHEELYRGSLKDVREKIENSNPRGEVVIAVEGI